MGLEGGQERGLDRSLVGAGLTAAPEATVLVLDTHIVLDLWVFEDPRAVSLRDALAARSVHWIATLEMREELQRVLAYPQIVRWQDARQDARGGRGGDAGNVLQAFDQHARLHPAAPRAPVACRDPDDQKFIDLALAHRARLVSRDRRVLALRRAMQLRGAEVLQAWPA